MRLWRSEGMGFEITVPPTYNFSQFNTAPHPVPLHRGVVTIHPTPFYSTHSYRVENFSIDTNVVRNKMSEILTQKIFNSISKKSFLCEIYHSCFPFKRYFLKNLLIIKSSFKPYFVIPLAIFEIGDYE